jgi:non-ribosomal peptide synthase protein (TIGR01720 family)
VREPLDPALVERAAGSLVEHHDALRLRCVRTPRGWEQANTAREESRVFGRVDLRGIPGPRQGALVAAAAAAAQAGLDLAAGPILRVVYFERGAGSTDRLLFVVHHLAVDGVSWRILLEDLQGAYEQLARGARVVDLPEKTTSFKHWAERLTSYTRSLELKSASAYWLSPFWRQARPLPVDRPGGSNTIASARSVSLSLSNAETTVLLQDVPSVYHTQINDVLLTALLLAFRRWTGEETLLVSLEGHGREDLFDDVDLSRTVGWFTSIFPVLLDTQRADHPGEVLKAVKEELRDTPHKGVSYGLLRYLSGDREVLDELRLHPRPEVSFNYLGRFDQTLPAHGVLGPAPESSGPGQSPLGLRSHLLDVAGIVTGGRLHMRWTFSEAVHERATIEAVASGFMEVLRGIIAHCQSAGAGGHTPSDFPLARLDQQALNKLFAALAVADQRAEALV